MCLKGDLLGVVRIAVENENRFGVRQAVFGGGPACREILKQVFEKEIPLYCRKIDVVRKAERGSIRIWVLSEFQFLHIQSGWISQRVKRHLTLSRQVTAESFFNSRACTRPGM